MDAAPLASGLDQNSDVDEVGSQGSLKQAHETAETQQERLVSLSGNQSGSK